jgi:hypothetical protein
VTPRGLPLWAPPSTLPPLEVARAVLDVLPYFDGGSTDEALARIRRDEGVEVERALVGKLVDFGLLRVVD